MKLCYNNRPLVAAVGSDYFGHRPEARFFPKVTVLTVQDSFFAVNVLHRTMYIVKFHFMHKHPIGAHE